MRATFIHQKMLEEHSITLFDRFQTCYEKSKSETEHISSSVSLTCIFSFLQFSSFKFIRDWQVSQLFCNNVYNPTIICRTHKILYLIEVSYIFQYYYDWRRAEEMIAQAKELSGLDINLSGNLLDQLNTDL